MIREFHIKNVILFVIIVSGFSISSCNDDVTIEPSIIETEEFSMGDFPIEIGNWWKYKVTDFYSNSIDTLLMEVVSSEINVQGELSYRCVLSQNGLVVDSSQVVISDLELSYIGLNPNYSFFADYKFMFPFEADSWWLGSFSTDTIRVVSKTNEVIIAGSKYEPVYHLKRSSFSFGYSVTQFQMVSPGVGIVNQSIDLFNGAYAQKQNFDLIEYHLE